MMSTEEAEPVEEETEPAEEEGDEPTSDAEA
jgi:hypothetical protein